MRKVKVTFLFITLVVLFGCPKLVSAQTFTFGAAGDFANGNNFQSTINTVAADNPNFVLALGDLSYAAGAESSWCGKWKAKYNNILLVTGNHDVGDASIGGNINTYINFCPFTLSGLVGNYGHQYYFDYPATNPIARVIMVRPGISGSGQTSYSAGGAGYVFTQQAIDSARSAGIQWIVVGMHKNYISMMEKPNELGNDFIPMLFSKKIDLIFQGHEHGYERSKQLSCAQTGAFNASCVVDSDDTYVKGAGTILSVIGTGGQGLRSVNTSDAEAQYFKAYDNTTYGYGLFTVSATDLSYQFRRSAGGTFTDSFTIFSSGTSNPTATLAQTSPTFTPTLTATRTPTRTPTPSPVLTAQPTSSPSVCQGDINGDSVVDLTDYSLLVQNFLKTPVPNTKADLNKDGIVDLSDYSILVSRFLKPCSGSTPTIAPTSTPTNISFQPSAPYYGTFYYMWYKTAGVDGTWSYWTDHGNNPPNTWFSHFLPDPNPSAFNPSTELYSANDYQIFKWQVSKMAEAKQEFAIASWWGQGTKEDIAMKNIINVFMPSSDNPYKNLRWSIYYEDEGFSDPSVSTLVSDLNHIKTNFANSPSFLKVSGKPVIFVYGSSADEPGSMLQRWRDANNQTGNAFYVVLKLFSGYASALPQPDSWHQYGPAVRSGTYGSYSSFVSPGFWLDDGSAERLVRNPTEFENAVKGMVTSNTTWKLVQTWNEWGEGTSVEPGEQVRFNSSTGKDEVDPNGYAFRNLYIDILSRNLPALEQ